MGKDIGMFEALKYIFVDYGAVEIVKFVDSFATLLHFEGKPIIRRGRKMMIENDSQRLISVIIR